MEVYSVPVTPDARGRTVYHYGLWGAFPENIGALPPPRQWSDIAPDSAGVSADRTADGDLGETELGEAW
jgi:hypothetical protein